MWKGLSRGKQHLISTMRDILCGTLESMPCVRDHGNKSSGRDHGNKFVRHQDDSMLVSTGTSHRPKCWNSPDLVKSKPTQSSRGGKGQHRPAWIGTGYIWIELHSNSTRSIYIETHFFPLLPFEVEGTTINMVPKYKSLYSSIWIWGQFYLISTFHLLLLFVFLLVLAFYSRHLENFSS